MLKSIVWQERYRCNFKCPYCYAHHKPEKIDIPSSDLWVKAFNRLIPETLDITGGEPFLNGYLVDIISHLSSSIRIGLTTNLSQSIERFVKEIDPRKIASITASYHPTQNLPQDIFLGRCFLLMSKGFNLTVNVVAHPEQMYILPGLKMLFQSMRAKFHVEPFIDKDGEIYPYDREQQEFLKEFIDKDRLFKFLPQASRMICSGGNTHLQVDPFGNAYRCLAMNLRGEKSIGNILDETFVVLPEPDACLMADKCWGCDRDKVSITKPLIEIGR